MANAFMTGNSGGNALAEDAPMGSGLVRSAADIIQQRQEWQRQYTEGETTLQFRDWLASQGISNAVMPR
jgi:hypothetical protein